MNFIHTETPQIGIETVTNQLSLSLTAGKKVLWLIAGGSNLPIAAEIMKGLRSRVSAEQIANLTVSLTDERYGPVGHADSNWKQLHDTDFDFSGIMAYPILRNQPLPNTVQAWTREVEPLFKISDVIIGQFGIGADGHVAGILPHSPAVSNTDFACGYPSVPFTRLTLSFATIRLIHHAYLFAFGESKNTTLAALSQSERSLADQPAQVLKEIADSTAYSDQL